MKALAAQPNLVEQVQSAVLASIASGQLAPGERLIQEQVAQALGVSRQPVQQALQIMRNQGVLRDAPGRGLIVAPLEPDHVQNMFAMRSVIEGLACRQAAERNAERAARLGPSVIDAGRRAVAIGSVARMIAADIRFHELIYELSGNPLVPMALATHLPTTQRMMGEILLRDETPVAIWDQHDAMLKAICDGNGDTAESLARHHIEAASALTVARLRSERVPVTD